MGYFVNSPFTKTFDAPDALNLAQNIGTHLPVEVPIWALFLSFRPIPL